MKNILARAHRRLLEQFACSNLLLAFDYDGTLAPIVTHPGAAVLRHETRRLLERLSRVYPVVVISGRAQIDAKERLAGIGLREVVGNHGIEPSDTPERYVQKARIWREILERRLGALRGVKIEDKGFSIAIHYRQSREKKLARKAILDAAASLDGVRIIGGKQVVNCIPIDAPHKGIALMRERARLNCDTAIYVGDDETDEDIFGLDQPGRLLSIRVVAKRGSAADYFIASQSAMDDLLRILLHLRLNHRSQMAR